MSHTNGERKGPSEETLKHLAGMLPSLVEGRRQRRIGGKGAPVGTPNTTVMPRKACPICGKVFDHFAVTADYQIQMEPCPQHAKDLAEGFTAFTNGNRYIIARSKSLPDMAGKIVPLGDKAFEALAQHYTAEWAQPKDNGTEQGTPPGPAQP